MHIQWQTVKVNTAFNVSFKVHTSFGDTYLGQQAAGLHKLHCYYI